MCGKLIVVSGDWPQLPPVVPRGGRAATVDASLKGFHRWQWFVVLPLTINLRIVNMQTNSPDKERHVWFEGWLLKIGNGVVKRVKDPPHMCVPFDNPMVLVQRTFPELVNGVLAKDACILTTLNKHVDHMNGLISDVLQGTATTYVSADYFGLEAVEDDPLVDGVANIVWSELITPPYEG